MSREGEPDRTFVVGFRLPFFCAPRLGRVACSARRRQSGSKSRFCILDARRGIGRPQLIQLAHRIEKQRHVDVPPLAVWPVPQRQAVNRTAAGRRSKLPQKLEIIGGEQANIADSVTAHTEAFDPQAEGEAADPVRVVSDGR